MQDADDLVDIVLVDGHACMLGRTDLVDDFGDIIIDVDAGDLRPGHHDVIYGDFLEVQYAEHHVLRMSGDLRAFINDRTQLVRAQMIFGDRS